MIDIIIPYHNSRDIIRECLKSIDCQNFKDYKVTILTNESIKDIIKDFSFNYQEIVYREPATVGSLRQLGLELTTNKYVMFIDSDDIICDGALNVLSEGIDNYDIICSSFIEINNKHNTRVTHRNNMSFLFGKLYSRKFLEDNNIKFNDSSACEDVAFNYLCEANNANIKYIDDVTYYWIANDNSITNKDNFEYTFNKGFIGYVNAIEHVINNASNISDEYKNKLLDNIMDYLEVTKQRKEYYFNNVNYVKEFVRRNYGSNC